MKRTAVCMIVLFLALMAAAAAFAQTGTSRVIGQVTDPSGAIIAGASVTLIREDTGASYQTTTTEAGTYVFDALPPASYTIRVEFAGFKTFVSKNNVLTLGLPLAVNVKLEVGPAATVVEVSETYERVQTTTSGNLGGTVDSRTLTDLPLGLESGTGGRNPLIFIRLQPGVVLGANTGGGSHVNGARDRAFNYTLDGIDVNETSAGGSEFAPLRTNPDSLQEFRVVTSNATAQYGRNSGAQVEMATRSGTNALHGSLFYFHRNSALAANEWENNRNGLAKPVLRQHQWGFSVGGPIRKNRTFFFMNYQGQRQISPFTRTRTVYTDSARRGIFRYVVGGRNRPSGQTGASVDAQGNPLLSSCSATVTTNCIATYNIATNDPRSLGLDPTIMNDWIGLTRLPNRFDVGDGLNTAGFIFSGGRLDPQRDFVLKFDHKFNDNHSVYVRYAWGKQDTVNDTTNDGEPPFPGLSPTVNTLRSPRNLAVGYRWVISPRVVNEFIVGGNHFTFNFITPTAGQVLPFDFSNVTDPLSTAHGNERTINTFQLVDNLSYNRGAHAFHAGINFRYQRHIDVRGSVAGENSNLIATFGQTVNTSCVGGSFGGSGRPGVSATGVELFCLPGTSGASAININDRPLLQQTINELLGRIGTLRQGFVAQDNLQAFFPGGTTFNNDARYGEYDFYFQDTWKLRPNFTVDLGLRWELKLHPTNPRGRIFAPDQDVRVGAAPSNTLRWVRKDLYDNDLNNISPSIGFAWDPFKNGKTAIRANYRLAYDRINTFVISSQIFNTVPGLATSVINTAFGQDGGPGGTGGRWRDGIPSVTTPAGLTPEQLTQPAAFGLGTIAVVDPSFRAPMTNMWELDIQRELWKNIVVDIAYIGRRASGLFGAYDVNQDEIFSNNFLREFQTVQSGGQSALFNQLYSPDTRRRSSETGSDFVRRQFSTSVARGSVGSIAQDAATRVQGGIPLLQLAGLSPFFFKADPQFNVVRVIDSNDFSTYHALQILVSRKFVRNLTFQAAYTFSKSLDSRSFDPTFSVVSTGAAQSASSTPFDIHNRRLNYARSDFDRRNYFVGYAIWDMPFGRGQRFGASAPGWIERFIEGWQVNGVLTLRSGRPFTVYSGANQLSNVNNATADCNNCSGSLGSVTNSDPNFGGLPSYFSPGEIARFSQPAPGTMGSSGRNRFAGPGSFNLDMAILKRTYFHENKNVEIRFEFFNLTNTPTFGFPTATITSTTFGRIGDNINSEARKIRVGVKLNF